MAFFKDPTVAVIYDNTGGAQSQAYTVNSNPERGLLVRVGFNDNDNEMTVMTYDGVAMTLIIRVQNASKSTVELWGLLDPSSGNNTLAHTALNGTDDYVVAATGLSGVNETTLFKNAVGATGNDPTPTVNATSTPEHFVFDVMAAQEGAGGGITITAGAGQTEDFQAITNGAGGFANKVGVAGSTEPGSASPVTMSWGIVLTRQWAIAAVDVLPIIELEFDMTAVSVFAPKGAAIFAGKFAMVGKAQLIAVGARIAGGRFAMTATAEMTCIPQFVKADADLPVVIPTVFFFIKNKPEFELLFRIQNLNQDIRLNLNTAQIFIRIPGFADKPVSIVDAGDGVCRYITSPGEFNVGVVQGVLHFILYPGTETGAGTESPAAIEFDSGPFQIHIRA